MEHNMAQLLRASKYAAHDPKRAQVWHNQGRFRAVGDWGFKRTVDPRSVRHHLVTLEEMDHPCNYTNFHYAEKKAKAVRRFVENFGNTPQPRARAPRPADEVASFARDRFPEGVDAMAPERWQRYLREELRPRARELRREWAEYKRARGLEGTPFDELAAGHCLRFLNLRLTHPGAKSVVRPRASPPRDLRSHSPAGPLPARDYLSERFGLDLAALDLSGTAAARGAAAPGAAAAAAAAAGEDVEEEEEDARTYAGPTYSHPQKVPSRKVRGRALNILHGDRSHLVVAVQGVTASLTGYGVYERARDSSGALPREVAEYWVRSADTDRAGNPRVSLQCASPLGLTARQASFWRNSNPHRAAAAAAPAPAARNRPT